jgi:hypothetical protein
MKKEGNEGRKDIKEGRTSWKERRKDGHIKEGREGKKREEVIQ